MLALVCLAPALHAEGLDELYEKPSSERSWGRALADLVGYSGFTRSYALVVGISDYTGGYLKLPTAEDALRVRDYLIDEAGFDYVQVLTEAEALQLALSHADRQAGGPAAGPDKPASPFRDCPHCPEMVVIPAGSFVMGSPASEEGRFDFEGPQRDVSVPGFALGRYEVTRGQFGRFVEETGHEAGRCAYWDVEAGEAKWGEDRNWRNPGFEQADDHPVTCVSWEDAQAYVDWLSKTTGHAYRLPSEAEWEYAARAGTRTRYFWGEDADSGCSFANGNDVTGQRVNKFTWTSLSCDDGHAQTAPVGRFDSNGFGLHGMTGNVWEWIEDRCYENYEGAPSDGSPWFEGNNSARVLRGGSWVDYPRNLRSAYRSRIGPANRGNDNGFRVARTLTP